MLNSFHYQKLFWGHDTETSRYLNFSSFRNAMSVVRKRYKAIMITESTCKNCWGFFFPSKYFE